MITKGQKINDRYEIIRSIGEGGMANVYLGYDTILDRNVAIKVLRGDLSNDEKFVRRFQREALSASSLAHPNIVEVYDVGEDDGIYYIVMEYVDGKTLKQLLKKRGTLTLSESIDIMSQLTDGMAHAHDSYIIHRDLKPQNIMIKDDGQIKITDFGIAMALNSTQLTQTNSVMGSVHYLPPEQASGKGCTIKSDIYSMGIIFYELLSGSLPFRGDNAVEIALKHMREPLPSLRAENPSIPQSIENIIKRATAKNPKNRYESARSMHEDLLTALDDSRMDEAVLQYKYPENENDVKKNNKKNETNDEEAKLEDTKELSKEDLKDVKSKNEAAPVEEDNTGTEDTEDKKSNVLIIILLILFVVILLGLCFVFFFLPKLTNSKAVTIPDCENLKVNACEKKLQAAGFEVNTKIKSEASSEIDKGRILRTEPEAGRSVKKGTVITMFKSLGDEKYLVEDFTGKNVNSIKTFLETKYGIKVSVEKKEVDKKIDEATGEEIEYDEDEIVGQSLSPSSEIKKGDSIILYVPNVVETFPDMVEEGWTFSDVESFCEKYGLKLEKKEQETSSYDEGTIIAQSRTKGSTIISGTTLRVTVAIKPKVKPNEKETEVENKPETEGDELSNPENKTVE